MEYIQLTDVVFAKCNITNISHFSPTEIVVLYSENNQKTYFGFRHNNYKNIYVLKHNIDPNPFCRLLSNKDYALWKKKKNYINQPHIILKSYGYDSNSATSIRHERLEFILKYELIEKKILLSELLKLNMEDAEFIR